MRQPFKILLLIILSLVFIENENSYAQDIRELMVIDEGMENKEILIKSLNKGIRLLILKESKNQLEVLTEELKNYRNLDAIHLMIPGKDGLISFEGAPVDNSNLARYNEMLGQWRHSFRENGDILIYTCQLAGSDQGKLVIRRMAAYTGLDVAASVNDTGNGVEGSDWQLEFSKGNIETEICFDEEKISKFPGTIQKEKKKN